MKNMITSNKIIGQNIKEARERAGLSQLDLAKRLGFESATAISLMEAGDRKVSAENLAIIAGLLQCDVKILLGQEIDSVDVQVALRADKNLDSADREAIMRFIELAKKNHGK